MKAVLLLAIFLLFPGFMLHAEYFRTVVDGSIVISPERMSGDAVSIGINGAVLINLGDTRFLRGVELEITAPQNWLQYRGALVMTMFNHIEPTIASGITDFYGRQIAFEGLPSRLRIIYHIPIRSAHGLRTTTSVTVPSAVVQPSSFPMLFRLMSVEKGLPAAFEQLRFSVVARPILSDEGAVRLIPRFPPQLRNRPFTVLINDNVISNISEEILLKEGEHHLVILSEDYRNESRRFIVERARVIDLIIELQDPTPIIIFEGPQNTTIFLNNTQITDIREPIMVEPGTHEVRFQIGDYTVIRTLNIQRGKTYRVALDVDITIHEEE
ncbi:MAG: hypothetical protein LBC80_00860 [Treponema sp.]|jgi:hypothetical protein|nr:hypothetical protein [Treponema sp.]